MNIAILLFFIAIIIIIFARFAYQLKKHSRKDWTKVLSTVSKVFSAILIPALLALISLYANSINNELEFQKHDLAILQEFHNVYFHNGKRGSIAERKLAFSYIDLVKDPNARFNLREFFMWDTLFSIVLNFKGKHYKYDSENPMWGTFAWNLSKMKDEMNNDKKVSYDTYINEMETKYAPLQIGEYVSDKEIHKIFHPPAFETLLK